jgi:hypothetical protein
LHAMHRTKQEHGQSRQRWFRTGNRIRRACRLIVINKARTAAAGDAQATGGEVRRRDVRPPSDWDISNKKPAADFSARALHDFRDDDIQPVICPTCQMFFEPSTNYRKCDATGSII